MSSEAPERDLDALADAVAERLEPGSYGDKMLLNRRQLLALAGAGVSAGALGTLGVSEVEAQEVVGQIGTDQERVDVYGGEGDFQLVDGDEGVFTEQAKMDSEPFELYISPTGDDSNTGLSMDDPLATFEGVINSIPRVGVESGIGKTIIVNIEDGATISESSPIEFSMPWVSKLKIKSDGSNQVTIESSVSSEAIRVRKQGLVLEDVTVTPTDTGNSYTKAIDAKDHALIFPRGSTQIDGGSEYAIQAQYSSKVFLVADNPIINGLGTSTTYAGVEVHRASGLIMDTGTIQNADVGINADRNSYAAMRGTIDSCNTGLRTQDGAVEKVDAGAVTNCSVAHRPEDGGFGKSNNTPDYTGTTDVIPETFEGTYVDIDNGDRIINGRLKVSSGQISNVTPGGYGKVPEDETPNTGEKANVYWMLENPPTDSDGNEVSTEIVPKWRYEPNGGGMRLRFEENLNNASGDLTVAYHIFEYIGK